MEIKFLAFTVALLLPLSQLNAAAMPYLDASFADAMTDYQKKDDPKDDQTTTLFGKGRVAVYSDKFTDPNPGDVDTAHKLKGKRKGHGHSCNKPGKRRGHKCASPN